MTAIFDLEPRQRKCATAGTTNSHRTAPETGEALIDTLRVRGPIRQHALRHQNLMRVIDDDGQITDRFTSGLGDIPGAKVSVRELNGTLWASFERSVPTFFCGHNAAPASVSQAREMVGYFYKAAANLVDWNCDVEDLQVSRVDVDRDFDAVRGKVHLLRGLASLSVARTSNAHCYYDSRLGDALTLSRGTRAWTATLYDKGQQLTSLAQRADTPAKRSALLLVAHAATHRLRYEVRLRRESLRPADVLTMGDLAEDALLHAARGYFDRCRFDTPIRGHRSMEALLLRLHAESDPNIRYVGGVYAMLLHEHLGLRLSAASDTICKYRRFAREWGVSAADVAATDGVTVALDYNEGRARVA